MKSKLTLGPTSPSWFPFHKTGRESCRQSSIPPLSSSLVSPGQPLIPRTPPKQTVPNPNQSSVLSCSVEHTGSRPPSWNALYLAPTRSVSPTFLATPLLGLLPLYLHLPQALHTNAPKTEASHLFSTYTLTLGDSKPYIYTGISPYHPPPSICPHL